MCSVADPHLQIRGRGGHPDPEIREGAASKKNFFWPFGPHFSLKIRGGGVVPSLGSTTAVDIDCCACVPLTSKAHLSGTTQDHSILGTIHKQEPITLSLIAQFLQYSPQLLSFTNFKKAKYNKYFKDLYRCVAE